MHRIRKETLITLIILNEATTKNKVSEKCNTSNEAAFQGSLNCDSTKHYASKGIFDICSCIPQLSAKTALRYYISKAALPSDCSKFSSYLAHQLLLLGNLWKLSYGFQRAPQICILYKGLAINFVAKNIESKMNYWLQVNTIAKGPCL